MVSYILILICMYYQVQLYKYSRLDSVDENCLSNNTSIMQYSKSQVRLLEVEKEKAEKQLHEAQISISQLQEESKHMKKQIDRYRGRINIIISTDVYWDMHSHINFIYPSATLTDMECSISSLQKQKENISVTHANEIVLTRDTMRTQFQEEKGQLMDHMRELRKQKQEADTEVRHACSRVNS